MLRSANLTLALVFLVGCGPSAGARNARGHLARGQYAQAEAAAREAVADDPNDVSAWRVQIRAAMAQGKLSEATELFARESDQLGHADLKAARMMAVTTLYQGLGVPSPEVVASTISIVERQQVEALAEEVTEHLGNDDDLIAAAASVALLRSHPVAPQIATDLLSSPDPKARALVVAGIGRKIGALARRDIAARARDTSEDVRVAVASALAGFGEADDAPFLLAFATDPSPRVRARALRGLASTGGDDALAVARTALDDGNLGVRLAAVAILSSRGSEADLTLVLALLDGDDLSMALQAAIALGSNVPVETRRKLLDAARSAPAWVIRSKAMASARPLLPRDEALQLVGRGMADARLEVRLSAARALLQFGPLAPAIEALEDALGSERLQPRLSAAVDLARRGHAGAIEILGRLVTRGGEDQRRTAIAAHRIADVFSVGLVEALADANIEVRLLAAEAILATAPR